MKHREHIPSFLYLEEADFLYEQLLQRIDWRQVKYYKPHRGLVTTPRLSWCCGFHNDEYHHIYLPTKIYPNKIPDWILPLKNLVEEKTSTEYNFILFSQYRDGQDSITYHSDDEAFLGESPTIASLTVGATRPFCLKNKQTNQVERFDLSHGDLFIMKENCQRDYLHSVPKVNKCKTRISLTFRKALNIKGSVNYYKYNFLDKII